jgi:hypothetical protein
LFKGGESLNLAGLSSLESYWHGDMDGDLDHDLTDFLLFRTAFNQANGAGAFESLTGAPEPAAVSLLALVLFMTASARPPKNLRNCLF